MTADQVQKMAAKKYETRDTTLFPHCADNRYNFNDVSAFERAAYVQAYTDLCMPLEKEIEDRIKYLKEQEQIALKEIDSCPVGSLSRAVKWDLIRELSFRRSELEMLFQSKSLSSQPK